MFIVLTGVSLEYVVTDWLRYVWIQFTLDIIAVYMYRVAIQHDLLFAKYFVDLLYSLPVCITPTGALHNKNRSRPFAGAWCQEPVD